MRVKKLTQAEARYQGSPKGTQQCSRCSMYVRSEPPSCTDVEGPIVPYGWCRIFDRKKAK